MLMLPGAWQVWLKFGTLIVDRIASMNSGGVDEDNEGAALRVKFDCPAGVSLCTSFSGVGVFRGEHSGAVVLGGWLSLARGHSETAQNNSTGSPWISCVSFSCRFRSLLVGKP